MEKTTLYLIILALSMFIGLLIMDNVYAERNISFAPGYEYGWSYEYDDYFSAASYNYTAHERKTVFQFEEVIIIYEKDRYGTESYIFETPEQRIGYTSSAFVCTYVNWC